MLYTTQITHPDGEIKNDNIFRFNMSKKYLKLSGIKYPKAKVEVMAVRAVLSCWNCGEPVILTDSIFADKVCQMMDRVCCCAQCDSLKTNLPGVNRK